MCFNLFIVISFYLNIVCKNIVFELMKLYFAFTLNLNETHTRISFKKNGLHILQIFVNSLQSSRTVFFNLFQVTEPLKQY
jgi:hypothetical protein